MEMTMRLFYHPHQDISLIDSIAVGYKYCQRGCRGKLCFRSRADLCSYLNSRLCVLRFICLLAYSLLPPLPPLFPAQIYQRDGRRDIRSKEPAVSSSEFDFQSHRALWKHLMCPPVAGRLLCLTAVEIFRFSSHCPSGVFWKDLLHIPFLWTHTVRGLVFPQSQSLLSVMEFDKPV